MYGNVAGLAGYCFAMAVELGEGMGGTGMAGNATGCLRMCFVRDKLPLHNMSSFAGVALLTGQGRAGVVQVDIIVKTTMGTQTGQATFSAMAAQTICGSGGADIGGDSGEVDGVDRCTQYPPVGTSGIMTNKAIDICCCSRVVMTTEKVAADVTGHTSGWIGRHTHGKGG